VAIWAFGTWTFGLLPGSVNADSDWCTESGKYRFYVTATAAGAVFQLCFVTQCYTNVGEEELLQKLSSSLFQLQYAGAYTKVLSCASQSTERQRWNIPAQAADPRTSSQQ